MSDERKPIVRFNDVGPDLSAENVLWVAPGMYLVRTQAGFNRALKQYHEPGEIGLEIEGYPKSYPSLIAITMGYRGYHYLIVRSVEVHDVLRALQTSNQQ